MQSFIWYDSLREVAHNCILVTCHVIEIHHLTASGKDSATKLEFKQRLSIALGVARGINKQTDYVP